MNRTLSIDDSPAFRAVLTFLRRWQIPGWILFAGGLAFSISICNWAIFVFVLLPFLTAADLRRRLPLYHTPLDWPFLALYASMILSSATAYLVGGTDFGNRSFLWTVMYTAPLLYFTVAFALSDQKPWLLKAMAAAFFLGAAANSAYAVFQFARAVAEGADVFTVRPGGRMFYMTYGGVMVLAISAAVATMLKGRLPLRTKLALGALLAVMLAGLAASLVRSAWVGLAAAVFVIAVVADRRLLWAFPVVVVLAVIIAPRPILKRAESILNAATDGATGETEGPPEFRVDIWRTSLRIARDYPLTGIGVHNTIHLYDEYKDETSVESMVPHAHNNYIQLVVERGIVGLAAFAYFIFALFALFIRGYRRARSPTARVVGLAGIGATTGFLVEGFFEYTFGDYEIVAILYTLAGILVALRRREDREEAAAA
ncbi:MAG: O-antigen ligase family protein [Candidatus Coatesbacteria bacterium]|nr:MAG: O-antigen ligase family protein [Candidatus Coatesbacteria bacterium]